MADNQDMQIEKNMGERTGISNEIGDVYRSSNISVPFTVEGFQDEEELEEEDKEEETDDNDQEGGKNTTEEDLDNIREEEAKKVNEALGKKTGKKSRTRRGGKSNIPSTGVRKSNRTQSKSTYRTPSRSDSTEVSNHGKKNLLPSKRYSDDSLITYKIAGLGEQKLNQDIIGTSSGLVRSKEQEAIEKEKEELLSTLTEEEREIVLAKTKLATMLKERSESLNYRLESSEIVIMTDYLLDKDINDMDAAFYYIDGVRFGNHRSLKRSEDEFKKIADRMHAQQKRIESSITDQRKVVEQLQAIGTKAGLLDLSHSKKPPVVQPEEINTSAVLSKMIQPRVPKYRSVTPPDNMEIDDKDEGKKKILYKQSAHERVESNLKLVVNKTQMSQKNSFPESFEEWGYDLFKRCLNIEDAEVASMFRCMKEEIDHETFEKVCRTINSDVWFKAVTSIEARKKIRRTVSLTLSGKDKVGSNN